MGTTGAKDDLKLNTDTYTYFYCAVLSVFQSNKRIISLSCILTILDLSVCGYMVSKGYLIRWHAVDSRAEEWGEGRQRESYRYCGLIYYLSIDILSYYDIQNTIYIDIILKTDYNSIYYLPLQADDCEGWVAIHILQANEKWSYFYQSQKKVLKKQDGDDTWREKFPTKWKWMQKTCKFILRSGNCKEYLYNFKVYMN